jgi:hypothetical protein
MSVVVVTLLPNTRSMSPRNVETSPVISPLGSSLLVRANEGRPLRAFGHAIVVLLDGKQTSGKFTTFLNITPPVADRGRITTNAKTNGSISLKAR